MLAQPGVVAKKFRADRAAKWRLVGVLFDVNLKFEVVQEDEITKATDPRPL